MSGPDLYRELKRRRRLIPVIFITATKDDTLRSLSLQEGAVDAFSSHSAPLICSMRSTRQQTLTSFNVV
jgi:CheY-like chemotaxis protein